MKKGKKRAAGPKAKHRGRPDAAPAPADNPFEQLYARKKFDILGKRQKGGPKSKLQVRSQANQRRKDTLLVEYKQLRKANNFIDRRFGEEDEELTAEEKAVMRFQKQRMKDAASSRFQLPDVDGGEGEGEGLTHMGRSLSEFDSFTGASSGSEDEADAALDAEATEALHFGGGFVRKPPGEGAAEAERPKTKKEVMEELIAKSKRGKADRQQQREEDLAQTEALDATFRELLGGASLQGILRPKGEKLDARAIPQGEAEAEFDRTRRELTWSARGAPGERTRTAEELAELERLRLEALERQRLKRMRGAGGNDDEFGSDNDDAAAPLGGFALRRHKAARAEKQEAPAPHYEGGGDDLDDDFVADSGSGEESGGGEGSGEDSEGEGGGALQRRRQARAAGDHELQARLRQMSAAIMQKHGLKPSEQSAAELAEAEDGSGSELSGSEDGGEASEGGSSGEDASDDDADEADEAGVAGAADAVAAQPDGSDGLKSLHKGRLGAAARAADDEGSSEEEESEDEGAAAAAAAAPEPERQAVQQAPAAAEPQQPQRQGRTPQLTGPLDVSFVPEAPKSYKDFVALVGGRPAADVPLIVSRIRGANAATLAADSRRGLQMLYGFLVKHFVKLAGRSPPALAHLDALTPVLTSMATEVPFYAATTARAWLTAAKDDLAKALADPKEENDYGWPRPSRLLSLRLWGATFPLSDKRHPVATPAALLTGAYLAACPVVEPRHAAMGLLLAGLAHRGAAAGGRLAPEALNFVTHLLADAARGTADSILQLQPQPSQPSSSSRQQGAASAQPLQSAPPLPLRLSHVFGLARDDGYFGSSDYAASALAAAMQLLATMARGLGQLPAFPELFQPTAAALGALASVLAAHPGLEALRAATLADIQAKSATCVAGRRPLVRKSDKAAAVKLYNPRFEEDFVAGKDFDPDRERAATKRLKRQVHKERRGAMRELRKDAAFLDTEREKERKAGKAERRTQRRAGFAVLEQLESDMKSGGQGGMWKKRKPR